MKCIMFTRKKTYFLKVSFKKKEVLEKKNIYNFFFLITIKLNADYLFDCWFLYLPACLSWCWLMIYVLMCINVYFTKKWILLPATYFFLLMKMIYCITFIDVLTYLYIYFILNNPIFKKGNYVIVMLMLIILMIILMILNLNTG